MTEWTVPANALRNRLQQAHGGCCPCCGVRMLLSRSRDWAENRTLRTRAHVHSTSHPGRNHLLWFWACKRCNHDQAQLAVDEWLLVLDYRGDVRAERVRAVARVIREAGLL